jgi:hypothetical protein
MGDVNAESGSHRGEDLEGADLSGKDLRGNDYSGAKLRSAKFRDAELGVPPRVGVVFLVCAMITAVAAGIAIGWGVSGLRDRISADKWDEVAEGSTMAGIILILFLVIIWKGFDLAFKVVVVVYFGLLIVNVIANLIWDEAEYVRAIRATAIVFFLVLAVAAGIFGRVIGGVFGSWSIALVAVLGGLASGRFEGGIAGIVVAVSLVFISKRAVRGDQRDRTLRMFAHRLIRRWGTKFVDADLTGADFTGADASRCEERRLPT